MVPDVPRREMGTRSKMTMSALPEDVLEHLFSVMPFDERCGVACERTAKAYVCPTLVDVVELRFAGRTAMSQRQACLRASLGIRHLFITS
jgi:hypothetical protein